MARITLQSVAEELGARPRDLDERIQETARGAGVKLLFEAYTPIWTGGFDGRTTPPTAQSIIGVARWLLRAVGPCTPPDQNKNGVGHAECEHAASLAFGKLGSASPVIVHVRVGSAGTPMMPGKECAEGPRPLVDPGLLDYLDMVVSVTRIKESKLYNQLSRASSPEDAVYRLREAIGECAAVVCKDVLNRIESDYRDELWTLAHLLRVPRFLQNAMGKRPAALKDLVPLAPGHCLTIDITARSPRPTREELEALALATASIATALTILGVGKGSTRGFGRYGLLDYTITGQNKEGDSILGKTRNLLNALKELHYDSNTVPPDKVGEIVLGILRELRGLAEQATAPGSAEGVDYILPRLTGARVYAFPAKCRDNLGLDCLWCIGQATLKNAMKRYRKRFPDARRFETTPGPDIHTWVLGLPRQNKSGKDPRTWTGYFYAPSGELGECCGKFRHLSGERAGVISEPRMRSPVILFPVGKSIIAVVPEISEGLLESLLKRDNKVLLHIGIHGRNPRNRKTRRIPVENILKSSDKNLPMWCEPYPRCRGDPGGIDWPRGAHTRIHDSVSGGVVEAWESAVEFLKTVLRYCR